MRKCIPPFIAVMLAGARYWLMSSPVHFSSWLPGSWFSGQAVGLTRHALNVACSWLLLVVIPLVLLYLRGSSHQRISDCLFLARPEMGSRLRIGLAIMLLMAVALGFAATTFLPSLRSTYPIFRAAGRDALSLSLSVFLTAALILATELFYRGVALYAFQQLFGRAGIYCLLPIYVLDHVGAPVAELAGSVLAGVFLGHLALLTRSLWPGFVLHVLCALTVDLTSLWVS